MPHKLASSRRTCDNVRMDLEFTPALQIAWNRAARISGRDQRTAIEPLDLLRGLLAEDESHVARQLVDAGLSLAAWQARHSADVGLPSEPVDAPLAISASLRLVMVRARQEVGDLTDAG